MILKINIILRSPFNVLHSVLVYIYIHDSQLNRPESVSLASLARQLWYVQNFVLIIRKEGGA